MWFFSNVLASEETDEKKGWQDATIEFQKVVA
jgi:hypothetical protein